MFAKKKLAAVALVALTLTGAAFATANEAQARPRWGLFAGFAAAAVFVGTAIASQGLWHDHGYRRCRFVERFDSYGNYIGARKVCRIVW
jgi:hypothetical protein